jgi:hypothetical protein
MQQEGFNLYNVFTKAAFDTGRQLTDINMRTYEKLVKRQVELASDFVESAVKQGLSHYVAAQRELAQDYANKAHQANKDTVKIITQAQDELNNYLGRQLPAAIEQVKTAVKDTAEEAANNTRSTAGKKAA